MHAPPIEHPEDLELIEAQIKDAERSLAATEESIHALQELRVRRQAQLVQLKRIRQWMRESTVRPTWWGTCLIEDLVADDVVRFELAGDVDHTVVSVNRNQDGRMVLRTEADVFVRDADHAVRVRFPRPVAKSLNPAGLSVVVNVHDVGDLHDAIGQAVAR